MPLRKRLIQPSMRATAACLILGALIVAVLTAPISLEAEEAVSGGEELFNRGVVALRNKQYADAASLFRLSYTMERRAETQCNLATTYDRWGGHERQAMEAYRRCAAEDDTGRFRQHALERAIALDRQLSGGGSGGGGGPAPTGGSGGMGRPAPTGGSARGVNVTLSPPSTPPRSSGQLRGAQGQAVHVTVSWQVNHRTSGCFFFSGPTNIGRRHQLGTRAEWRSVGDGLVTLTFQGGHTFTGRRNGNQVTLSRRSSHNYNGPWFADESIQGTFNGEMLQASYVYHECNARRQQSCPGNCTIRARMTARPATR